MNYEDLAAELREKIVKQSAELKANIDHMQERAREHIDKGEEADYYSAKSTIDVNTALMDGLSSRLVELAGVQGFALPSIKSCQSVDKFDVLCKAETSAPITKDTNFEIEFLATVGLICQGATTSDNISIKSTGRNAIRGSELMLVKEGILLSMQDYFHPIEFLEMGPILAGLWNYRVALDVPEQGRRDFGVLDGHIMTHWSTADYHSVVMDLNNDRTVPIPVHKEAKIYTNAARTGIWMTIDRENKLISHIISKRH